MCRPDYGTMYAVQDFSWVTQAYSMGQFLREYAYLPSYVPLHCYSVHGVNMVSKAYPHETDNAAPFFLYTNEMKFIAYTKTTSKPCYKIPTSLPWQRKQHKLQAATQKRTLAFFQHTTPDIHFLEDSKKVVNDYIDTLLTLPESMYPLCVCLHMHDVRNDIYKFFLERDIAVYTAGNVSNAMFYKEFYDILLRFSLCYLR